MIKKVLQLCFFFVFLEVDNKTDSHGIELKRIYFHFSLNYSAANLITSEHPDMFSPVSSLEQIGKMSHGPR